MQPPQSLNWHFLFLRSCSVSHSRWGLEPQPWARSIEVGPSAGGYSYPFNTILLSISHLSNKMDNSSHQWNGWGSFSWSRLKQIKTIKGYFCSCNDIYTSICSLCTDPSPFPWPGIVFKSIIYSMLHEQCIPYLEKLSRSSTACG